jgi:hypothetical protein
MSRAASFLQRPWRRGPLSANLRSNAMRRFSGDAGAFLCRWAFYYADFGQTSDEEVIELLSKARKLWTSSAGSWSGRSGIEYRCVDRFAIQQSIVHRGGQ